jgi:hypothetical protein
VHPLFERTPLSRAAEAADADVVELLLGVGTDPNADSPLADAAEAYALLA